MKQFVGRSQLWHNYMAIFKKTKITKATSLCLAKEEGSCSLQVVKAPFFLKKREVHLLFMHLALPEPSAKDPCPSNHLPSPGTSQ